MRVIALALCALLTACGGGGASAPPVAVDPPPPPLHITEPALQTSASVVFIGDSITAMWPLKDYVPDAVNAGVSAEETTQMLERFDRDVLSHNPAVVVILAGTNDIRHRDSSDLGSLVAMVQKAQAANIRVIVGTLLPTESLGSNPTLERQLYQIWNQAIADGVGSYGYDVANFHDAMILSNGKPNQTLFVDGLHPNEHGYNEMWYVLRPILAKLAPATQ